MRPTRLGRRRVLHLAGLAAAGALAGCSDGGDGDGDGSGESEGGYGSGGSGDGDSGDSDGATTDGSDGDGEAADGGDGVESDAGDGDATTGTEAPTETPGTDDLDLREANVVGVEFDGGDGSYGFDVTLHHDDDGEEGYANWWQVERLDGTRLGRRDLTHPHSRQPFTRSTTVDVPGEVICVVVRGHDQTHRYGGRAVLVNLASGATKGVMQGSDPQSFDEGDCP